MKDFAIKHPIILFLMLDSVVDGVVAILNNRKYRTAGDRLDDVCEIGHEVIHKTKENLSKKQAIGFKAD